METITPDAIHRIATREPCNAARKGCDGTTNSDAVWERPVGVYSGKGIVRHIGQRTLYAPVVGEGRFFGRAGFTIQDCTRHGGKVLDVPAPSIEVAKRLCLQSEQMNSHSRKQGRQLAVACHRDQDVVKSLALLRRARKIVFPIAIGSKRALERREVTTALTSLDRRGREARGEAVYSFGGNHQIDRFQSGKRANAGAPMHRAGQNAKSIQTPKGLADRSPGYSECMRKIGFHQTLAGYIAPSQNSSRDVIHHAVRGGVVNLARIGAGGSRDATGGAANRGYRT